MDNDRENQNQKDIIFEYVILIVLLFWQTSNVYNKYLMLHSKY